VTATGATPTLHTLLAGLIDYAGLFPPASLSMAEAVANYASYLEGPDAWALGRFVVPVARLDEMAADAARYTGARAQPWRLSALAGEDLADDAARIRTFNAAHAGRLLVDVVELRAPNGKAIDAAARAFSPECVVYLELPLDDDSRPLHELVRRAGARAKARTGGTSAAAFPDAPQLARFIARCARLGIPFKATAGLHHPLRGEYRLTYAADAPTGTMFGFLNVCLAAAFALTGFDEPTLVQVLEERDPSAIGFWDRTVRWRDRQISFAHVTGARASLALAFGSCSFREPLDDLHRLGLL
jgi:hypothetical protein